MTGPGPISKWAAVSKTLHTCQMGILAVQETHLSPELAIEQDNPRPIHDLGTELHDRLQCLMPGDRSSNPQTLWQEFKDRIKKEVTAAAKLQMCKILKHIVTLQNNLKETRKA